jgi:flagellin
MMTVINTNTAALNAQYNLSKVQNSMDTAMERLSSGKRINTAADDAAGIAISTRMEAEINGLQQAIRNASDGQALIDTAEGAHDEVTNMLQRMRELAVQSANDTNSDSDRAALQLEIDQLLTEIDRVAESTSWAGKTLMGGPEGGASTFNFQVGSTSAAQDQISINIDDTSADSLGIGNSGLPTGGRTTGHASVSYEDGVLTVVGQPKAGDKFDFDLNGIAVTATFSEVDQYPDTPAGAAAQIKSAVDVILASNPTKLSNVSVVDNGNGTLTFTQSTSVSLDTYNPATATHTATIDEANGTITWDGTYKAEKIEVNVNGITVDVTRAASDGFEQSNIGNAAAMKQAIEAEAGLENVIVTDHADGSLTIKQKDAPYIDGLEVTLTTAPDVAFTYDDTDTITVSGAWTAGQEVSLDIFGETVSFTVQDNDNYGNTLAGISSQLAAAINDAGIIGLTAAKNANANTVTLTADVLVTDAKVNAGSSFIAHTIGDNASVLVKLSAADKDIGNITADTPAAGDAYSFNVMGHEVSFVVGTDGYSNDVPGVSEQMKDAIDALNIAGLSVTAATATNSGVTITRSLTGSASVGSTVVTNITSLASDEVGDPTFSGSISVASAAASANAIERIDAALLKINEQRAELGSVSNRLEHTITNLSNVNTNIQGSQSRIQDADFATETSNLTKSQILSQAATAMLAQANASKQSVLSLLQG